jgi:hypothetical protein
MRFDVGANASNSEYFCQRFPSADFLDTLCLGLDLLRVCSSSRNSSASLSDLAASVWSCRLPQFDRVSLGVMQAGKPSDAGIRFRVNLNLYPCSS